MERTCEQCGRGFDTRRSDARYCSGTCRGKASRIRTRAVALGGLSVTELPRAAQSRRRAAKGLVPAGVAVTVREQLEKAGRLGTYAAQQALVLARRLDAPALDSGAGVTAVSKELDRLMTGLLADAGEPDVLDEIQGEVVQFRRRSGALTTRRRATAGPKGASSDDAT